jgi:hypothetical protein
MRSVYFIVTIGSYKKLKNRKKTCLLETFSKTPLEANSFESENILRKIVNLN